MSTGGLVTFSYDHYRRHFINPIDTLYKYNLINESKRGIMKEVLMKGVLPCFAGKGDSAPDRLMSSTLALTFAGCGVYVMEADVNGDDNGTCVTVTSAGLLYFAAWYVLVYAGAVHMLPTLKVSLSRTGSGCR